MAGPEITTREGAASRALEDAGATLVATVPDTWTGWLAEQLRRASRLRVIDVASEEGVLLVSYRGDERDPVYYHVPKGRITESTLNAWGIRYARAAAGDGIAAQIAQAFTWVQEAKMPFALLFSAEDLA